MNTDRELEWTIDLQSLGERLRRDLDERTVRDAFSRLGGTVETSEQNGAIQVRWRPHTQARPPADVAVSWLETGDYGAAMIVLETLLVDAPEDEQVLYNLGMAHSDHMTEGRAAELLGRLVELRPEYTNARVALGVAQLRLGDDAAAAESLETAVRQDDENPWAHRNLAAVMVRQDKVAEALAHLRRATDLAPRDLAAWFGLTQVLERTDDLEGADETYQRVVELAGPDGVGEAAREARSRIAETTFRDRGGGAERMDAVMYCLAAMEKFDAMGEVRMGQVVTEITLLGRRGLDVNDPEQKYELRSLPGSYSGLQLVSLMYVGWKRLQPEEDVGFDLSKEYEAALSLHDRSA
jgi:Flp pilus assembly protein TadD